MDNWLAVEVAFLDGRTVRFGPDERDAGDIPGSIEFSTGQPGGFTTGSFVLQRPASLLADDTKLLASVRVYGPGGRTFYEGRIVGVPQVGADQIRIETEGFSEHLSDDETFNPPPFIDIDQSHWGPVSTRRSLALALDGRTPYDGAQTRPDNSGTPALELAFSDNWAATARPSAEAWYDAGPGCYIGQLYASWTKNVNVDSSGADGNWNWALWALSDDLGASPAAYETTANLRSAGPGTASLTVTGKRRWAMLRLYYDAANLGGAPNLPFAVYFTPAVYGDHGLTIRGTMPGGIYGSDIIAWALDHGAPMLNYTLGDSIEQSVFAIPHFAPRGRMTVKSLVEQVTGLGGAQLVPNDWGCWENREFFHRSPGTYGRTWRVRSDQMATLTASGPDSKERTGAIVIEYDDGSGNVHSVGFPGSGADYETTDLLDTDPQNPATKIQGKRKYQKIGISNQEGALFAGRMLLQEANLVDWRGEIDVQGEVPDSAGNLHPVCAMRAGDRVVDENDEYPTPRPVAGTSYSHDNLSNRVDVGASAHRGEVFFAQVAAATDVA